jgi:FolB domain-containing protein
MTRITIVDLEVFYCVGVTEEERAKPQRLLITVDINFDFSSAAVSDRIEKTLNYEDLANDLLGFGEARSWKLLEKLVSNIADHVLNKYKAQSVLVEAKKFVIPKARYVSVILSRSKAAR